MKITNSKRKKIRTSNEGRLPLINTKYYIIEKYHRKYELKEGRLVKIKLNKELKVFKRNEIEPILSLAHEHPLSGHFRLEATLSKLKERYYWPKIKEDIKSYIQTCDQCQRRGKTTDKNELK